MRHFLSPSEMALLDSLPEGERLVVRELFDLLDAHLVENENPVWMKDSRPRDDVWWKENEAA